MRKVKGVTLVELAIVITIFFIVFIMLTPLVNKMRDRANIIKCSNNIRLISLALHMYAADHDEAFPPALADLYPSYVKERKVFICPSVGDSAAPGRIDYEYVPGMTESSPSTEVIIYDRATNHKGKGRNIVRVNGSVEWLEGAVAKR